MPESIQNVYLIILWCDTIISKALPGLLHGFCWTLILLKVCLFSGTSQFSKQVFCFNLFLLQLQVRWFEMEILSCRAELKRSGFYRWRYYRYSQTFSNAFLSINATLLPKTSISWILYSVHPYKFFHWFNFIVFAHYDIFQGSP